MVKLHILFFYEDGDSNIDSFVLKTKSFSEIHEICDLVKSKPMTF